jgi:hypothetical protein
MWRKRRYNGRQPAFCLQGSLIFPNGLAEHRDCRPRSLARRAQRVKPGRGSGRTRFRLGQLIASQRHLRNAFKRRPRPSTVPLVSGIAPNGGGNSRSLSETQLRQPEAWLRLHQQGWTRNIIPPANSSYMVQVEHSDGAALRCFYFRAGDPKSTLRITVKVQRFDAGRRHLPLAEVDDLIAMLRKEA